jgi:hypothetical protein
VHAERPITPKDKSRELQRKLYLAAKRNRNTTLKAAERRLSESRMRENLTYGSRWQGMETRIW